LAIYEQGVKDVDRRCRDKSSLKFCKSPSDSVPHYMILCSQDARSGILWFRLGGWLIYKRVEEYNGIQKVICQLCKTAETAQNLLFHCSKTADIRKVLEQPTLHALLTSEFHMFDDTLQINKLGSYLNKVRNMRNTALSVVASNVKTKN
jgi:hypothetical protein